MNTFRRTLLKGGSAALVLPLLGAGLLQPRRVLAADWSRAAFTATTLNEALKAHGCNSAVETRDIVIQAPEIAENGAKVEVEVTSNIAGTRSLSLFADRNPMPLCAALEYGPDAVPYTRIQLKLAETTRIRAMIKTVDGKTWAAYREIKVTLGGCGG